MYDMLYSTNLRFVSFNLPKVTQKTPESELELKLYLEYVNTVTKFLPCQKYVNYIILFLNTSL